MWGSPAAYWHASKVEPVMESIPVWVFCWLNNLHCSSHSFSFMQRSHAVPGRLAGIKAAFVFLFFFWRGVYFSFKLNEALWEVLECAPSDHNTHAHFGCDSGVLNEHSLHVFCIVGGKLKDREKKEKEAHTDIEWIVEAARCEVAPPPPGSCKLSYSIINKVVAFWKSLLEWAVGFPGLHLYICTSVLLKDSLCICSSSRQ